MRQYYILTLDPRASEVFNFIREHALTIEVHLNRTRFWVPDGIELTEFILRFGDVCAPVDPQENRATGRRDA